MMTAPLDNYSDFKQLLKAHLFDLGCDVLGTMSKFSYLLLVVVTFHYPIEVVICIQQLNQHIL